MNEFEKYVKDNLYGYKSPVPQGLWERIAKENDKRKPAFTFWKNGYFQSFVLAVIAVGLISSAYIYLKDNYTITIVNNKKEASHNTTISINAKSPSQVKENKNTIVSTVNVNQTRNKESLSSNEQLLTKTKNRQLTNDRNIASAKLVDLKESNSFTQKSSNNVISEQDNLTVAITNPDYDEHHYEKGSIVANPIELASEKLVAKIIMDTKKTITTIHLPENKEKKWYVSFYGSPNYDVKKVSANNGLNANYLHTLDSSQKLTGGFTVGFNIAKSITSHLILKSGIQFKEASQQFRYAQTTTKNIAITSTRSYINNAGGITYEYDTTYYIQSGYRLMKTFNNYKSIEIPVIASWEAGKNKWHFSADGGVVVNLISFYSGQTFDPSLNLVPLSAKQSRGMFKSNVSFSLYGGCSLLYNVGGDFDVFASPYYKFGLSNNNISAIGYNTHFNSTGIDLGIRYKIPRASIK